MGVVNDLVPHEDRRAPLGQRLLDDLDGPVHAGAETARRGQKDGERLLGHAPADGP